MKLKIATILLLLFSVPIFAQQNKSVAFNDGPYLFYKNGQGNLYWVNNGKKENKSFFERKKKKQSFMVYPDHCKADSFKVKLKPFIKQEACIYKNTRKLLVFSDIEGEFCSFIDLLKKCNVITKRGNWKFGRGHIVFCGDIFDRGSEVSPLLWFLYKLEKQAQTKGGYVHVILGNHDIMNLNGNIRYIHKKYHQSAKVLNMNYKTFYDENTELGKWLRSKNIIEKIGDKLFVHAGLSKGILDKDMNLNEINSLCRSYYDHPYPYNSIPDSLRVFFNSKGLFWYRGWMKDSDETKSEVDRALDFYDCKHIFIGHSIVDEICKLFDGKVFAVDVNHHKGVHEALLIKGKKFYRLNIHGQKIRLK